MATAGEFSRQSFDQIVETAMTELRRLHPRPLGTAPSDSSAQNDDRTISRLRRAATAIATACALTAGLAVPLSADDDADENADTTVCETSETPKRLTPRQGQILQLVLHGHTCQAIATQLNIAVSTVQNHRSKAAETLGAPNAVVAAFIARDLGLI